MYSDLAITVGEGLTPGNPCTGSALRTVTNTYDGLGRLTLSAVTAGQGFNDKLVEDTYDAAGIRLSSAKWVRGSSQLAGSPRSNTSVREYTGYTACSRQLRRERVLSAKLDGYQIVAS